jgi:hypothetical protein
VSVPAPVAFPLAFRALFVSAVLSAVAVVVAACGGEEGAAPPDADVTDTGATTMAPGDDDATMIAPPHGVDATTDGPTCATTLEALLQKSDAISQGCIACYEQDCASVIKACDGTCSCPEAFNSALECSALGGNQQTCTAVALQTLDPSTLLQFYQCTNMCKKCNPSDAAADANDSSTDAPADAADSSMIVDATPESGGDGASDAAHD